MALAWVLLKRRVIIEHDAGETGGDSSIGGAKSVVPSRQDRRDAVLAYMRTLKPDARFSNPPELSSIRILRPAKSIPGLCGAITSAHIASADKNLVALFAGPYRPGSNLKGGYLIYDASKKSLSAIPQPPYDYKRDGVGQGAVVVALDEGGYVLAELTKVRGSYPPEATLCTWRSSTAEWVIKVASFPPELSYPIHLFNADTCFSYGSSTLCWVDLFKGMVVCDLHDAPPQFRFVPFPAECQTYDHGQPRKFSLRAEEFRSIACVGDTIKFVTMDGYCELPGNAVSLTIWALHDLYSWEKCMVYSVRDIWESETHLSLGLLNILPSFPVLSMDEDGVVYLVLNDLDFAVDCKVEYKTQYLLRVDVLRNKVEYYPQGTGQICSQLFASDCCAYFQGLEDHQVILLTNTANHV